MLYCQYRYAALSVQGCCTIGIRLLHYRYQAAALFWYHYSSIFTLT